MKDSRKALLYTTALSMLCDVIMERAIIDLEDFVDCLHMVGLNPDAIAELPPVLAVHAVCKAFGEMEMTDELIADLQKGDSVE